jgi:hypothetical protein
LIAYRAFVLVEIDLRHRSMINDPMTDLSLLRFCLLMVSTPARWRGFRPSTVTLHEQSVRRQIDHPPRFTAAQLTGAGPLSPEDPPISRFLAFDRLPSSGSAPVLAYSACAYSPRPAVAPHEARACLFTP